MELYGGEDYRIYDATRTLLGHFYTGDPAFRMLRCVNTFDQAKEALRGLLAYDEAQDCQVCGIGRSEQWKKAHAVLAKMEEA